MGAPRLFFGSATAGKLLESDDAYNDDGLNYNLLATTDRVAPNGDAGECAFRTLFVPVQHEGSVPLRVTPLIDGTALDAVEYTLSVPSARKITTVVVPLRTAFPSSVTGYATLGKFVPRGTWFQAKVETFFEAVVTTALTGTNNDLTFYAKLSGTDGNAITVRYVNPGTPDATLSVSVAGTAITVNLATNGASAITSTATLIKAALDASADASALVRVALATSNDGSGIVIALAATSLAGGVAPAFLAVHGVVLEYDPVDVAMQPGANK